MKYLDFHGKTDRKPGHKSETSSMYFLPGWILCFVLSALAGASCCALPGSAMSAVRLEGRVDAYPGQSPGGSPPESPLLLTITLPADYGLGASDRLTGDAVDFGHRDQTVQVQPKSDGSFSSEEFSVVYHATIFLLPPLGAIPPRAPMPHFLVVISSHPEELYLIYPGSSSGEYRVYNRTEKRELRLDEANWRIREAEYHEEKEGEIEEGRLPGWRLVVEIERNVSHEE